MPPQNDLPASSIPRVRNSQYRHLTALPLVRDKVWHEDKIINDKVYENIEALPKSYSSGQDKYGKFTTDPNDKTHSHKPTPMVWRYDNKLYDFTNFANKHPGGEKFLLKTRGQDITDYVKSFHFEIEKLEKIMKKYQVDENYLNSEGEDKNLFKLNAIAPEKTKSYLRVLLEAK